MDRISSLTNSRVPLNCDLNAHDPREILNAVKGSAVGIQLVCANKLSKIDEHDLNCFLSKIHDLSTNLVERLEARDGNQ